MPFSLHLGFRMIVRISLGRVSVTPTRVIALVVIRVVVWVAAKVTICIRWMMEGLVLVMALAVVMMRVVRRVSPSPKRTKAKEKLVIVVVVVVMGIFVGVVVRINLFRIKNTLIGPKREIVLWQVRLAALPLPAIPQTPMSLTALIPLLLPWMMGSLRRSMSLKRTRALEELVVVIVMVVA